MIVEEFALIKAIETESSCKFREIAFFWAQAANMWSFFSL